jgi:hypothetical protein
MIIVFSGSIGRFPIGGHAWINMQYLIGLRELGHEVYYLEECGDESWVYNWETQTVTDELAYPAGYVERCLQAAGLGDRWMYRAGDRTAGMSADAFRDVCAAAGLLLVHAVPLARWRPEYLWPRRRAFIDADPGFIQMSLNRGDPALKETVAHCQTLFTVGQRLGAADCRIPETGRRWSPTVAPVVLSHWPVAPADSPGEDFTCVLQWRGFRDEVYEGETYGQKDREFPRFITLPRLTSQRLRIALTGAAAETLTPYGWSVQEGWTASRTPQAYQEFIAGSRAELSVAKHGYVRMQGGWFSDRSVCYLASGRPVLVQDTGLGDWLPVGRGVVAFRDLDEAVAGVEAINGDYAGHRAAARRVAEEIFAAERVLPPLVAEAADG